MCWYLCTHVLICIILRCICMQKTFVMSDNWFLVQWTILRDHQWETAPYSELGYIQGWLQIYWRLEIFNFRIYSSTSVVSVKVVLCLWQNFAYIQFRYSFIRYIQAYSLSPVSLSSTYFIFLGYIQLFSFFLCFYSVSTLLIFKGVCMCVCVCVCACTLI